MGTQKLLLVDPDEIETHNLPNQIYRLDQVGLPKVEALSDTLREYAEVEVGEIKGRFEGSIAPIVISGVDSMTSREEIWRELDRTINSLYIDARMGAQVMRIYSVNMKDEKRCRDYEKTLYTDKEAVEAPCTNRAIIYTVFGVASFIANNVKKFAKGEKVPFEIIFDFVNYQLMVTE